MWPRYTQESIRADLNVWEEQGLYLLLSSNQPWHQRLSRASLERLFGYKPEREANCCTHFQSYYKSAHLNLKCFQDMFASCVLEVSKKSSRFFKQLANTLQKSCAKSPCFNWIWSFPVISAFSQSTICRQEEKTINYTDAVFILGYIQVSELLTVYQEWNKLHFHLRFTGQAFITQRISKWE